MIKYRGENRVNREHKDRLFKMIFGRPENRELTLSLYNAINGSNYEDPDAIEITTIENAVYVEKWREIYRESGNERLATEGAIKSLSDDSPIKPYLLANKSEVTMSIITEYDEERTMELFREEARIEGIEQGRIEGEAKGRAEGEAKGRIDAIKTLLKKFTEEEVVDMGFSLDDINSAMQMLP